MKSLTFKYSLVGTVFVTFLVALIAILSNDAAPLPTLNYARLIVEPVIAMVALTGLVWVLMVVYRNVAFIRGMTSERYFQTYNLDVPAEWVERPTRAFMNLLEAPLLFYVISVLMLTTVHADSTQVALAWLFVATRYIHAFVYIAFNYIPLRFAAYASGVVTLGAMWFRFAQQTL